MGHFSGIGFMIVFAIILSAGWVIGETFLWLLSFINISVG